MRKGISPIIAAVLLIAVAVGIGVLLSNWAQSWTTSQINKPDVACSVNTNYIIEEVRWNYTGNTNKLLIKVTNKGVLDIYNFTATLDNSTKIYSFNSTASNISQGGISKSNPLRREHSAYITIDLAFNPTFGSTLSKVTIGNDACKAISAGTSRIINYP